MEMGSAMNPLFPRFGLISKTFSGNPNCQLLGILLRSFSGIGFLSPALMTMVQSVRSWHSTAKAANFSGSVRGSTWRPTRRTRQIRGALLRLQPMGKAFLPGMGRPERLLTILAVDSSGNATLAFSCISGGTDQVRGFIKTWCLFSAGQVLAFC